MTKRSVLVTGATGQVGGAVATALLDAGHTVRALVRDAGAEKAQALAARGMELAQGDLGHVEQISAAARGVDSVFVLTTPWTGVEAEVEHGINAVDGAVAAGVGHVVFSSVGSADQTTGIPHFDSKARIEEHLKGSGVPWTITGPVFFYENFFFPWNLADLERGKIRLALPADRPLQMVALRDIGRMNALALGERGRFLGLRIDLASDELTGRQIADVFTSVRGTPIAFEEQPVEEIRSQSDDLAIMYEWFNDVGYSMDIPSLRESYPEVGWTPFAEWAATHMKAEAAAS